MKESDVAEREFPYGTDHHTLIETVDRFCREHINPNVDAWEAEGILPAHEIFGKLGKLGLFGITLSESDGGAGLDYSFHAAFVEALGASRCASVNLAVAVQTDMATPALALHGSQALKAEFLQPTVRGELVACLGVSEVDAGSDMGAIQTFAKRDGDDLIINGGKMWTTNGAQADWMCLLARTSEENTPFNMSLICVPLDLPGITRLPPLKKLGMNASDTIQTYFDSVRVPARNVIGVTGRGLYYQMEAFARERLTAALSCLRPLERALAVTADYLRERRTFGRPVLDNQHIQFELAVQSTKIELLRGLCYRAVAKLANGERPDRLISMAKLTAGRIQREIMDVALQYHGGAGYLYDSEINRMYRDARLTSIGGGSDEMMLAMIARYEGWSKAQP